MKQYTLVNRVLAGVSFLITLITYMVTLQPSVPFWDCGEFTAAAAWQQVPHPPGAPLWLMVGRWFHLLPFGDVGWRLNFFSAMCSAGTAALVYLIIVKLIERWRPFRQERPIMSYLPTFAAGVIGTLSFTWSDTQWFNSVESEVYAAGAFLIALMMWLMMRWSEVADRPGHERYLLMMAYVVGLAFGVHLLALLVVPGIGMVIYFRRYKFDIGRFLVALLITGAGFYLVVYQMPLQYLPKMTAASPIISILLVLGLLGAAIWARRNGKPIVYISMTSVLLIFLGFSTYTHILLRANAHPPMNENEPDTLSELVSYLGREQYGYAPSWPRRYQTDDYYTQRQNRYGEWYPPTRRNPETGQPVFDQVNLGGEINFMFTYQIYHMYIRYFLWNFVGRASDVQNAPVTFASASPQTRQMFIAPTGQEDIFPIQFYALPLILGLIGFYYHLRRDWKMALVYTTLFLLLGVLSTLQQNQQEPQPRERDYFYIGSYMIFTMWIGIGACGLASVIARKRSEKQEEDQSTESQVMGASNSSSLGMGGAVLAVCFLAVPVNMMVNGWKLHDRSKNWVPWDYSYNILQSLEKDAILFTNGDNDTFPLWYLQDVAGVRRDVRVVNLSLGQTSWYIWQLKNERPWGAKQVKLTFSDDILLLPESDPRSLRPEAVREAPLVSLEVPANVMSWATNGTMTSPGTMSWRLQGGNMGGTAYLGVQHKLVRSIMEANKWERPIYFSSSTQSDVWSGMEEFFRSEGLAYRIMPVKQSQGGNRSYFPVNLEVMRKCLMETLPDDQAYTEPHYGFKFRYLNDSTAFFNEDTRRTPINYRLVYMTLADHEVNAGNKKEAIATLDKLEQSISPDVFEMPYQFSAEIANIYKRAGAPEKAAKYAQRAISVIDATAVDGDPYTIYVKAQMYAAMGDYDRSVKLFEQMRQQAPGDPNVRSQMENAQVDALLAKKDTAGAIAELRKIIAGYDNDASGQLAGNAAAFRERLSELTGQPDNTVVGGDTSRTP